MSRSPWLPQFLLKTDCSSLLRHGPSVVQVLFQKRVLHLPPLLLSQQAVEGRCRHPCDSVMIEENVNISDHYIHFWVEFWAPNPITYFCNSLRQMSHHHHSLSSLASTTKGCSMKPAARIFLQFPVQWASCAVSRYSSNQTQEKWSFLGYVSCHQMVSALAKSTKKGDGKRCQCFSGNSNSNFEMSRFILEQQEQVSDE